MQNTGNTMENKVTLSPTASIFNPGITITHEHWAVSFIKHSRDTNEENSHHGILILQADNKLYRREILPNPADTTKAKVRKDTRMWDCDEEFESQVKQLIWQDDDTKATIDEIAHLTWSIEAAQGLELLADIEKDCVNPPKFFIGGNTSVFRSRNHRESIDCSVYTAEVTAAFSCLYLIRQACLPDNPVVDGALIAGQAIFSVTTASIAFFTGERKDPDLKAHNCATWCVEKLTRLNIPAINKDLGSHFADKFAYVTGLHISVDEADRARAQALLVHGAKSSASKCLSYTKDAIASGIYRKEAPVEPHAEGVAPNTAQGFAQGVEQEAAEAPAAGVGR